SFESKQVKSRPQASRRHFLRGLTGGLASLSLATTVLGNEPQSTPETEAIRLPGFSLPSFSMDENHAKFFLSKSKTLTRPVKLFMLTDTHLYMDDERGQAFTSYSQRMAGAYNRTKHWQTGEATMPSQCFEASLAEAKRYQADAILLTGDILSFPSEAGVDWLCAKLSETGIPYYYIAGNHDWHYEGLPGSDTELRAEWASKRLGPLYQNRNPLGYAVSVGGVRLLMMDDSTNEIVPEQLTLLQEEIARGEPILLFMHIPLYAPGRPIDYACGHPDWNAAHDVNYAIERRERWPQAGHSLTTHSFYQQVVTSPNILGVFTGHVHVQTFDLVHGKPLVTVRANAEGAFQTIELASLDA
ncbi:MAG: metallophosphoesterase, partial [Thermoguttaceae bacterium]|nr:metallophosphoesterase [Thermoguttaceae bacterium]